MCRTRCVREYRVGPVEQVPETFAASLVLSATNAALTAERRALAMEYLVTMTTHVPAGATEGDVENIRAREALRARELADEGHLLRLWRPPLQPGEWRTVGLFAAEDDTDLEKALASMPLRVWRTDEATPLGAHPNDPASASVADRQLGMQEFLSTFTETVPTGVPTQAVDETRTREAARAHELAEEGHLRRLWTLPGESRALGLWRAQDAMEMQTILQSLPLAQWMTVEVTPLSAHPNDPGGVHRSTARIRSA
jgi:muconolactone delta-isomerase